MEDTLEKDIDIPCFIADEMNGDLARWLRILGYDCLYFKGHVNMDKKILYEAKKQNRVVLTSDRALFRSCRVRGIKSIHTMEGNRERRLAHIIEKIGLNTSLKERPPRCSICNTVLREVGKRDVSDKLPRGLIERYKNFWLCPKCSKIYWEGSHWRKIMNTIERAKTEVFK